MKKTLLTTLMMVMTVTTVLAQDNPEPWDGSIAERFMVDEKTIYIDSPAELAALHDLWDSFVEGDILLADLRERLTKLGVVLDVQPCQCYTDRVMAPLRLGPKRALEAYPFRALWDTGLIMAGSTDAPMEEENMWIGIWNAVTRADDDGSPLKYDSSQKLTLDEALTAYTVNPWRAVGKGDEFGMIKEGYRASFLVMEDDVLEVPAEEIGTVRVGATYIDGEKCYELKK